MGLLALGGRKPPHEGAILRHATISDLLEENHRTKEIETVERPNFRNIYFKKTWRIIENIILTEDMDQSLKMREKLQWNVGAMENS